MFIVRLVRDIRDGYIYVITNKTNDMKYVGQTARDLETRFLEHCAEKRGHSKLHVAIQEEGWRNFEISLLETVPINKLDEREKYWIKELNTREEGYNIAAGGKLPCEWPRVQVVENGLIFDSKEDMCRIFSNVTYWSMRFLSAKFKRVIEHDEGFLGYHFKEISSDAIPSDYDVLEDWIKTLNIQYMGKHVYCIELDKEFETIASAAQYMLDNNLYETKSKTPMQSLVTSIGKNIHGKIEYIKGIDKNYTFEQAPGSTDFSSKKVYCPQLDKTFESQTEAGKYFIENNIWKGIKLKTAKLRISDIVRGAFPDYKGYTFMNVE